LSSVDAVMSSPSFQKLILPSVDYRAKRVLKEVSQYHQRREISRMQSRRCGWTVDGKSAKFLLFKIKADASTGFYLCKLSYISCYIMIMWFQ